MPHAMDQSFGAPMDVVLYAPTFGIILSGFTEGKRSFDASRSGFPLRKPLGSYIAGRRRWLHDLKSRSKLKSADDAIALPKRMSTLALQLKLRQVSKKGYHVGVFTLPRDLAKDGPFAKSFAPFAALFSKVQTTAVTSIASRACSRVPQKMNSWREKIILVVRKGCAGINRALVFCLIKVYKKQADSLKGTEEHDESRKRLEHLCQVLEFISEAIFFLYFMEHYGTKGCSAKRSDKKFAQFHSRQICEHLEYPFLVFQEHQGCPYDMAWSQWSGGRLREAYSEAKSTEKLKVFALEDYTVEKCHGIPMMEEQILHSVVNEILTSGDRHIQGVDIPSECKPDHILLDQALELAASISTLAKDIMGAESETDASLLAADDDAVAEKLIFLMNTNILEISGIAMRGLTCFSPCYVTKLRASHTLGDLLVDPHRAIPSPRDAELFINQSNGSKLLVHTNFVASVESTQRPGDASRSCLLVQWVRTFVTKIRFDAESMWTKTTETFASLPIGGLSLRRSKLNLNFDASTRKVKVQPVTSGRERSLASLSGWKKRRERVIVQMRYSEKEKDIKGFCVGDLRVPKGENVEEIVDAFSPFAELFAQVQTTLIYRMGTMHQDVIEPLLMIVMSSRAREITNILATTLDHVCTDMKRAREKSGPVSKDILRVCSVAQLVARGVFEMTTDGSNWRKNSDADKVWSSTSRVGAQNGAAKGNQEYGFQSLLREKLHHYMDSVFDVLAAEALAVKPADIKRSNEAAEEERSSIGRVTSHFLQFRPLYSGGTRAPLHNGSAIAFPGNDLPSIVVSKKEAVNLAATISRLAGLSASVLHEPLEEDEASSIIMLVDLRLVRVSETGPFGIIRFRVGHSIRLRAARCIGEVSLHEPVSPPKATKQYPHPSDSESVVLVHPVFIAKIQVEQYSDRTRRVGRVVWVQCIGDSVLKRSLEPLDKVHHALIGDCAMP